MLAELGMIRPFIKTWFDQRGKEIFGYVYWEYMADDSIVIESNFNKYYSELPRIEITLRYMKYAYNKYQCQIKPKRLLIDDIKFLIKICKRWYII